MPETPEQVSTQNFRCFGHTCLCDARWMFTNETYGCNNLATHGLAGETTRQCTGRHIATCPECARSLWETQPFLSTLSAIRLEPEAPRVTHQSFWVSIDYAFDQPFPLANAFPPSSVAVPMPTGQASARCTCAACGRRS